MPAGGQDERDLPAEQLRAAVAGLPGAQVISDAGDHVRVGVDLRQVDRRSQHRRSARPGERVVQGQADEVTVQGGRQPGGIRVPVQNVEGLRRPALQVVVDPVVPDQVVGPQPGEHLGERPPVQVAARCRGGDRCCRRGLVDHRAGRPGPCLVKHGDAEAEAGDAVEPADLGEMSGDHGGHDAARAQRADAGPVSPGDGQRRVERAGDRGPVAVEIPARDAGRRGCAS